MLLKNNKLIYPLLILLICINISWAEVNTLKNNEIGFIDFQFILKNSKPSKKLQSELEKGRELFQKTVGIEEGALRDAEKQLSQKRNSVDDEVFNDLVKEFEKQVSIIQKLVQNSHQQIETNFQLAQKKIADIIKEEAALLAAKNNIFLVLKSDAIIYAHDSLDLTLVVLNEVNKRNIEFDFENVLIKIKENINQ